MAKSLWPKSSSERVDSALSAHTVMGLVISALLDWIEQGLIDFILGGPPCATWTRARFHGGGPPLVRR